MANEDIPAVPVIPGNQTSEYKVAKSAAILNILGLLVGAILSIGTPLVNSASPNTKYAIIGGCIIGLASVVNKTLIALGYVKGRSDVKVEALRTQAVQSLPPQN